MVVLTKSNDYTYGGVKFRKGTPAEVSAEAESYLIGTGYFDKVEKPAPAKTAPNTETKPVSKPAAKKPAAKVAVKTEDDTEE